MGRTRTDRITIEELERRIRVAELKKNKILDYLKKIKDSYAIGNITYSEYTEKLNLKREGKTIYEETPESMASKISELINIGVNIIGGCCGTSPAFIELFVKERDKLLS